MTGMIQKNTLCSKGTIMKYQKWWKNLEDQWKKAFNEAVLNKGAVIDHPSSEELHNIRKAKVFRFAGPGAPFPNMSFELKNLSGVADFEDMEILVVTFHKIKKVEELKKLEQLKSLFLNNNQIETLKGIGKLRNLKELYVQGNQLSSLLPLKKLTQLETIYCNYNKLNTLQGITEAHTVYLRDFFCLPNDVTAKEVLRFEQKLGIRCHRG